MHIYLLRHAHAEDGGDGLPDEARALTAEGQRYAALAGRLLARLNVRPAHIYTSPRVRARQTAEAVGAGLKVAPEIRDEVNFGFGIPQIEALTADLAPDDAVIFVGHEPDMSGLVRELTGALAEMKKCGLARIDLIGRTPPRGDLVWLLTPRVYDALEG